MENAEITQLLGEVHRGNVEAQSRLASVVYNELHRLAARCMYGERPDHSLQATVLVHEAFIRLVAPSDRSWQNRTHFFAAAAQIMRRILIDYARNRRAEKRGGGQPKVQFDEAIAFSNNNYEEWIAVDQALDRLAERDTQLRRVDRGGSGLGPPGGARYPAGEDRGVAILRRVDGRGDWRGAGDFAPDSQA